MILQDINVGTIADDGTGDNPRAGAIKINANNALIEDALSGAVAGSTLAGTEKLLGLDGTTNKAWLVSQVATYVTALLVDSAPGTLDTLNELAAALGDDANFATTMTTALAGKQPLDADLTAIAALTTTSWGRDLLTLGDPKALRALISSGYILGQSASNSALTGTTTETTLATIAIPAGELGPNGSVEVDCWWSCTNSANSKTTRIKVAGNLISSVGVTTVATLAQRGRIANRNSATSQITGLVGVASGFGSSTASMSTFSIDTTVAQDITITAQLANAGDTINLESYIVRALPGA